MEKDFKEYNEDVSNALWRDSNNDEITALHPSRKELEKETKQLRDLQYELMRSGALVAIEKCKNATGQRRVIDMYVSANQIAEDLLNAMDSGA